MALFQLRWLRRIIRRHTNPIPEEKAEFWKRKLSILYMVLAWNAFGAIAYNIYRGNSDWARKYKSEEEQNLTPAQYFSRNLGIKDATVYRITGFNVDKYEIHNDDGKE